MKESTTIVRRTPSATLLVAALLASGLSGCKPEQSGTTSSATGSSDPSSQTDPGASPGPVTINATQGDDRVSPLAVTFGVAGLTFMRPEGWTLATPGAMRAAELRHPESDDAMIVFTHFGERGAGSVPDNLTRWARQVVDASNQPTLPQIAETQRGALKITVAKHEGTYMSGTPGTPPTPKPGTVFLGAIIEGGPRGPIYVRAHGPASFMATREGAIREMFLGVRVAD